MTKLNDSGRRSRLERKDGMSKQRRRPKKLAHSVGFFYLIYICYFLPSLVAGSERRIPWENARKRSPERNSILRKLFHFVVVFSFSLNSLRWSWSSYLPMYVRTCRSHFVKTNTAWLLVYIWPRRQQLVVLHDILPAAFCTTLSKKGLFVETVHVWRTNVRLM